MLRYYLLTLWPHIGGFVLGLVAALVVRRRMLGAQDKLTRVFAIIGSAIALLVVITPQLLSVFSISTYMQLPLIFRRDYDSQLFFAVPFFVGAVTVALMLVAPIPNAQASGADLRPRSILSFTRTGAIATIAALSAVAAALAIAGGRLSTSDEYGHFRMYYIESGGTTGGVEIYGWFFSVPALITLAVFLSLTFLTLWRISKPRLGSDAEFDTAVRKGRSTIVTTAAIAALVVHLGYVCQHLSGSASLKVGGRGGFNGAWVEAWTTFAALESTLWVASAILLMIGIALWSFIFWQAVLGVRRTARA